MNSREREQALLRLIETYRDQACQKLRDEARAKARELISQAYAKARSTLHQRVLAERSRAEEIIQVAEAERATRMRRRVELRDAEVLAAGWPRLREAMLARWVAADTRQAWVDAHLAQAIALLPPGQWQVRHPSGWPADEQELAVSRIQDANGRPPVLIADPEVAAGLILSSAGAVLDASLDGLLRDRGRIESRLLALWHAKAAEEGAS
jgi:vacuolar-type H+-ATPase subunit H